jgi:hypothetical protein
MERLGNLRELRPTARNSPKMQVTKLEVKQSDRNDYRLLVESENRAGEAPPERSIVRLSRCSPPSGRAPRTASANCLDPAWSGRKGERDPTALNSNLLAAVECTYSVEIPSPFDIPSRECKFKIHTAFTVCEVVLTLRSSETVDAVSERPF